MTDTEWAALDQELFVTFQSLRSIPQSDPRYDAHKDRFGTLFVKKLGGWLASQFGHSLWVRGIETEDLLHEVYLRVHDKLFVDGHLNSAQFENAEKLRNYLYTVAQKTALTVLADHSPHPPTPPVASATETPGLQWIWKYLPFLDPERRQVRPEMFEETDFREPEQRALFLWYVDGAPHKEIAERLETSANAAKQLVYRAKLKLLTLMPRYAAEECLALLSSVVPEWLRHYTLRRRAPGTPGPASEIGLDALEMLSRLAEILRLGLREDRPQSFNTRSKEVVQQKLLDALSSGTAREAAADDPAVLEHVGEVLAEVLSYLALEAADHVPKRWSGPEAEGAAEPRELPLEEVELLTLLFFCLCALLPDRPDLDTGYAEPARQALAQAWPSPSASSQDWLARIAETVEQLDRWLAEKRAVTAEPGDAAELQTSMPPEQCLIQTFVYEADESAKQLVQSGLPSGFVADWLRGLKPAAEG